MSDQPIVEGVETKAWAIPAEGVTLDDLTLALSKQGTPILERDEENNRLLVGYDITGPPPTMHIYDEQCCVGSCTADANHIIPDQSHWCDLHLQGVRSLIAANQGGDPHELAKEAWG